MTTKRVLLLKPRGFCAGVVRAIDIVQIALETFGAPIYVRKEIVHNSYVVTDLAKKGAIFVNELDEVPEGARVIYSAHGVSPAVRQRAKERGLKVVDATCPLVTKVHVEAIKFAKQGYSLVLVGHRDHEEVEGTQGEAPDVTQVVSTVEEVAALVVPDPNKVAYLTQTTLSLDEARYMIEALKKKFPNIVGPHAQDICYATENRQTAVKNVAHGADLVLVVGSKNSSNSNRLVEVSKNLDTNSYLIDTADAIQPEWLEGVNTVAVTAGASAPEVLVKDVVEYLQAKGYGDVDEVEVMPENVRFGLPPEIVQAIASAPPPQLLAIRSRQRVSSESSGRTWETNVSKKFADRSPQHQSRRSRAMAGWTSASSMSSTAYRAKDWLLGQQHADGYWCGELEADVMLEADYIFMHYAAGHGRSGQDGAAVNEILRHQNEDGGWSQYPGGPSDINYGVKSYLALKLMGWSADHPVMVKAREWVLAHGGVVECNTFTKIYLCSLGQYDYDAVPAVPPEIVLFPNWFYFNIYEISSWSRGILVPLSIIYAKKPFKKMTPEQGIDELFVGGRDECRTCICAGTRRSWSAGAISSSSLDRMMHWFERVHIRPLRKVAMKKAEKWMLARFEKSDGLGAIYPAMLNSIVAMRVPGLFVGRPAVDSRDG